MSAGVAVPFRHKVRAANFCVSANEVLDVYIFDAPLIVINDVGGASNYARSLFDSDSLVSRSIQLIMHANKLDAHSFDKHGRSDLVHPAVGIFVLCFALRFRS